MGNLPNFLVIGAPRCGTSSLARCLRAHPEVFLATPKELHFFDREHERGLGWYAEHFAGVDGETLAEASPSYLYRAEAVERMAAAVPSVAFRSLRLRRLAKQLPDPARRVVERLNTRSFATRPSSPHRLRRCPQPGQRK